MAWHSAGYYLVNKKILSQMGRLTWFSCLVHFVFLRSYLICPNTSSDNIEGDATAVLVCRH